MKKYIFLDVDGVLSTAASGWRIDIELLRKLFDIIRLTDARVIISSSWKEKDFIRTLRVFPPIIRSYIDGQTPDLPGRKRGHEIAAFLESHPCDRYIILDDERENLLEGQYGHLVETSYITGITDDDVRKGIALLNG